MPPIPPERIVFDDGDRAVQLLRCRPEQVHDLVEGIQDSLEALKGFMPWAHSPENNTVAFQATRIEDLMRKWDAGEDFCWHLYRPIEGAWHFSGAMGLHPRCLNPLGMEIGYWMCTEAAGQGLCTLATQMLVLTCIERMGLERVQIGCDQANHGSRRVIEKVGFPFEGVVRRGLPTPTAAQRVGGALGTGHMHLYGLTPADMDALNWPARVRPALSWHAT